MTYQIQDKKTLSDYIGAHKKAREVEALLERAERLINEINHCTVTDLPELSGVQHQMAFATDDLNDSIREYETFADGVAA